MNPMVSRDQASEIKTMRETAPQGPGVNSDVQLHAELRINASVQTECMAHNGYRN